MSKLAKLLLVFALVAPLATIANAIEARHGPPLRTDGTMMAQSIQIKTHGVITSNGALKKTEATGTAIDMAAHDCFVDFDTGIARTAAAMVQSTTKATTDVPIIDAAMATPGMLLTETAKTRGFDLRSVLVAATTTDYDVKMKEDTGWAIPLTGAKTGTSRNEGDKYSITDTITAADPETVLRL